MSERYIYILLTNTGSLVNRMIKLYTEAPYNHVSLSMDLGLSKLYSFGRRVPRNPVVAGFVREDVVHGTYRLFPNTTCALMQVQVSEETYQRVQQTLSQFEQNQHAYRYNFIGLFGVMLEMPVPRKNAYFCSQFVAEVLETSGLSLWQTPAALVSPDDFLQHEQCSILYEGRLQDYPLLQKLGGEVGVC
ncbi:hypothetical protein [Aureibacillus halotolerans]|uniref:Permuted papain-like amidase YaeF/Yiix C92 family enzyme n=1 Tax=Aureibacillus halotolerans TaxID=1508390 RepID=A0A4R6TX32_9BACI|nr:hypothetical protein [Aureibacillus halotolerans]TDQ36569.1 hypothetical protein EV213_11733 [Aureibacillus halotolerans]